MVRLFIEDRELELTSDVQVAISKQFEDLSNPTKIINDWSKTVSIPFSTKNNDIFGHIYNLDRLISYHQTVNYLTTPSSVKKWNGSGYDNVSLVDGNVVCDLPVQYVQVGLQKANWTYSKIVNYSCANDSHSIDFIYNATDDYRLEFSFRDLNSDAPNNEVYFVQWDLFNLGLIEGEKYNVTFKHKIENGNYIIYDYSLTKKQSKQQPMTGINFNPLKKLSFRIERDSEVIMTGYAKMNQVKQNNGKGTYELTLFGELGKLFQEMKKITFDTTTDNTNYLIDGSAYVEEYINKELVAASWKSEGQTKSDLQEKWIYSIDSQTGETVKKPNLSYKVTDIIGFAPSNAYKEGFDFTTFQTASGGEGASSTFQEALEKGFEGFPNFEKVTGISPSTIIPNGISPRGLGEYRSYLQLPYIYWNKLFQIFKAKAESITGYKFILDSNWFNSSNPYWYNLVYMLKQFDIKDGGTSANTYKSIGTHPYADTIPPNTNTTAYEPNLFESAAFAYRYIYDGTKSQWTTQRNIPITSDHCEKTESIPLVQGNMRLTLSPNERVVTQAFSIKGELELYYGKAIQGLGYNTNVHKGFFYSPDVVTCVNLKYTGANGTVRRQIGAILQKNANQPCVDYANNAEAKCLIPRNCNRMNYKPDSTSSYRGTGCVWEFNLNFPETNLFYSEFGDYVDISIETNCWFPDGAAAMMPYGRQNYMDGSLEAMPPKFSSKYQFATLINFNSELRITSGIFRSGSLFTLNDIWNKEVSIFDEILRYCKMFRIGIYVDESNKQLMFTPLNKYFENYTVTDWTNKIDKSKDFNITPITFEDKYILFNYEDGETKNNKIYKEKYGYNYGEYRLTTDYNFNNKTNKLFEGQKPSNIISPAVLTWNTLFRENKIIYRIPVGESYIDDADKENKMIDTFGQFYFHNGLNHFTKTDMPSVYITDDTKLMSWNQTYFYTGGFDEGGTFSTSDTYPNLSLYRDDNMITFAIPKECYVFNTSYSNKKGIYDNFWEKYINERYNIQNKLITCYVTLKPTEFSQFKWNQFVKIGNQLCIVNKIYDYDVTSNSPTKVDLITIQNIDGYTSDNYNTNTAL